MKAILISLIVIVGCVSIVGILSMADNTGLSSIGTIAQIFGSIATAGTFIYLVIKDTNRSKQITDLAKIAIVQHKRLKLEYKPILQLASTGSTPTKIDYEIKNIGKRANIEDLNEISGIATVDYAFSVIENMETQRFHANAKNEVELRKQQGNLQFEVLYTDEIGNRFKVLFAGEGLKGEIVEL